MLRAEGEASEGRQALSDEVLDWGVGCRIEPFLAAAADDLVAMRTERDIARRSGSDAVNAQADIIDDTRARLASARDHLCYLAIQAREEADNIDAFLFRVVHDGAGFRAEVERLRDLLARLYALHPTTAGDLGASIRAALGES